jgi:hypothetical protein
VELKPSYYRQALKNLEAVEVEDSGQLHLFDDPAEDWEEMVQAVGE